MISPELTNQFLAIVDKTRWLDRKEQLTCYAYDAFVEGRNAVGEGEGRPPGEDA